MVDRASRRREPRRYRPALKRCGVIEYEASGESCDAADDAACRSRRCSVCWRRRAASSASSPRRRRRRSRKLSTSTCRRRPKSPIRGFHRPDRGEEDDRDSRARDRLSRQDSFKDGGEVEQEGHCCSRSIRVPIETEVDPHQGGCHASRSPLAGSSTIITRAKRLIDSKQISREQFDLVAGDRAEAEAAVAWPRPTCAPPS